MVPADKLASNRVKIFPRKGWAAWVRYKAVRTVIRDTLSMGLGTWIVINEVLTGHIHQELLYLAGLFLAGPTVVAGANLLRGNPSTPGTPGRSSRPARQASRSSSPSSSPTGGDKG